MSFSGRPGTLILFVVLFTILFTFRGYLKRRISYLGKTGWNLSSGITTKVPKKTSLESISEWFKSLYLSKKKRDFAREKLFPIGVLSVLSVFITVWTYNIITLPKNLPACESSRNTFTELTEPKYNRELNDFHTCNPWYATGVTVKKGIEYRIEVNRKDDWMDDKIPANADGLTESPTRLQKFMSFTKRNVKQKWFKLLANIGDKQQIIVGASGAKFTAKYSGPLYLYVNDTVCDICLIKGVFAYYRNNKGTADIRISQVSK